jgi:hypothetical protein
MMEQQLGRELAVNEHVHHDQIRQKGELKCSRFLR